MNKYKTIYLLLWATTLLWAGFQELGLLPQAFIPASPAAKYICDMIAAATAIIGTYAACKLFVIKKVRQELETDDRTAALAAFQRWNGVRLTILAAAILPSAFIYYAQCFSQTALFCMLIALTGSLFCWPYSPKDFRK